jgi:hypothetical protein
MMIESKMLTATEIECREAWAAAELAEDFAANQRAQAKLLGDLAAFLEPSSRSPARRLRGLAHRTSLEPIADALPEEGAD